MKSMINRIDGVVIDGYEIDRQTATLSCDNDAVPVRLGPRTVWNPAWFEIDAAGHYHAFTHDMKLPTLREIPGNVVWCRDCHDNHSDPSTYECFICGPKAPIVPGTVSKGASTEYIPGVTTWKLVCKLPPDFPAPTTHRRHSVRVGSINRFGLMESVASITDEYGTTMTLLGDLHQAGL